MEKVWKTDKGMKKLIFELRLRSCRRGRSVAFFAVAFVYPSSLKTARVGMGEETRMGEKKGYKGDSFRLCVGF